MNRLPFSYIVVVICAVFLGMPLEEALAQRGGRGGAVGGGGRGVGVAGGRSGPVGGGGRAVVGGFGGRPGVAGFGRPGFGYGRLGYGGYGFGYGGLGLGYYGGFYPYSWPYSYYPSGPVWVGDFFGGYAYDYVPPVPAYPPAPAIPGGYMPLPPGQMPPMDSDQRPRVFTALVQIYVPTDSAELWFNGVKTAATGLKREFTTPELAPGRLYSYEVRARWMADGKQIDVTRTLQVQAGAQAVLVISATDREQLPLPTAKQLELPLPTPK